MRIIDASPDNIAQIGYEGEDQVTQILFKYPAEWLNLGEGTFSIRVLRHGENEAYNAEHVTDDRTNCVLTLTVTDVELSIRGTGEMQVVYSGSGFVKKSPIYSYYVFRAIDETVDPPTHDVYVQIIESLSGQGADIESIRTDMRGLAGSIEIIDGDVGDLSILTTTSKTNLVSAINEVNAKDGGSGGSITVDDALSNVSKNPVQNKVINSALGLISTSVSGLQTAVQSKADTSTVTALSDTVTGLQTTVAGKADASTVTTLSGTVTSLQTAVQGKADTSYVDTQLSGKASTAVATTSVNGLMSAQDKSRLDTVYADYSAALEALGGGNA